MQNNYITFQEYIAFGGIVSQTDFTKLERKAEHLLDYYTQDRLKSYTTIPDIVKELLTEYINRLSDRGVGERVKTFSNGKVSMTFDDSRTENDDLYQLALEYLPVSLISGVIECE